MTLLETFNFSCSYSVQLYACSNAWGMVQNSNSLKSTQYLSNSDTHSVVRQPLIIGHKHISDKYRDSSC